MLPALREVMPASGKQRPRAPHVKGSFSVLLYMLLTVGQGAQGPRRVRPPATSFSPLDNPSVRGTPEFSAHLRAWVAHTFETCRHRCLHL